jgi:hypothetical protein
MSDTVLMIAKFRSMGILRNLLHVTALVFALLMPLANGPDYSGNWDLFFSGVLPATAPIIIIVIMLDVMMSHVWKDAATEERLAELNLIIKTHCIVALVLLLSFLTIFLPVLMP